KARSRQGQCLRNQLLLKRIKAIGTDSHEQALGFAWLEPLAALQKRRQRRRNESEDKWSLSFDPSSEMDRGHHEQFICYWIAFASLYRRSDNRRREKPD